MSMRHCRFLCRSVLSFAAASLLLPAPFARAQAAPVAPTAAELKQAAEPTHDNTWWKHAVLYEIYPRSFQDSNGDGVGDLNGITQRLDYLQKLGVDAIWIAPMYPSPQVDFGYDISDFNTVDPQYGSLADFDRLVAEAKKRNIRVLLDTVVNHSSDKHPWFVESASSRTNPRADWYVWNDGVPANSAGVTAFQRKYEHDGMVPPNNWISIFGGSAWQWVPARKQFYYHKFYIQQPDLNYRNPAVEKAMLDSMRFWLDRGVAGFRLDAVPTLFEDPQLRNEPEMPGAGNAFGDPNVSDVYTSMLPEVHGVLQRMRAMVDSYPGNRVLVGETYLPNTAELMRWYGTPGSRELNLPMDFLVGFRSEGGGGTPANATLSAPYLRRTILEMETELGDQQPLLVFDNHDNIRSYDRLAPADATDGQKKMLAKLVAAMLYTTRATALTYYGAELGMTTTPPERVEDVQDPIGRSGWPKEKGRDGERTPMQWTPGPQAGFSTNPKTWLPIPRSAATVNVETERNNTGSLLNWSERLIALRRSNPALHDGGFVMLNPDDPSVLIYLRTAPDGSRPVLVMLNTTAAAKTLSVSLSNTGVSATAAKTLLSSDPGLQGGSHALTGVTIAPYGTWVAVLQ